MQKTKLKPTHIYIRDDVADRLHKETRIVAHPHLSIFEILWCTINTYIQDQLGEQAYRTPSLWTAGRGDRMRFVTNVGSYLSIDDCAAHYSPYQYDRIVRSVQRILADEKK